MPKSSLDTPRDFEQELADLRLEIARQDEEFSQLFDTYDVDPTRQVAEGAMTEELERAFDDALASAGASETSCEQNSVAHHEQPLPPYSLRA